MQDMEVVLNKSTTFPCSMLDKVLMELVELYMGIGPDLLPPTTQVIMVDHLFFVIMLITELDIGITPANFCI